MLSNSNAATNGPVSKRNRVQVSENPTNALKPEAFGSPMAVNKSKSAEYDVIFAEPIDSKIYNDIIGEGPTDVE